MKKYIEQRANAVARGIPFLFTFDEWVNWWENYLGSNWFKLRGTGAKKYCMARYHDQGPYANWNVECITNTENRHKMKAIWGERRSKLTMTDIRAIYDSHETYKEIAKRYKIGTAQVYRIKAGLTWKRLGLGSLHRKSGGQGARTDLINAAQKSP